jgi:1,4-alpha-glucan branching enzyme
MVFVACYYVKIFIEKFFITIYYAIGIHVDPNNNVTCLEWAPNARNVYLTGEFSILQNFKMIITT